MKYSTCTTVKMERRVVSVVFGVGKNKENRERRGVLGEWVEEVDIRLKFENMRSKREEGVVRLVLVSDTHTKHEMLDLPKGDVLIHAGDCTNNGTRKEIAEFDAWLATLDFKHKILVPGNHDTALDPKASERSNRLEDKKDAETQVINATILRAEMVEVMGMKIFGLPHTIDPFNKVWWAYRADNEEEMKEMASKIPSGLDILVSHSPPWQVGDTSRRGKHCGSKGLAEVVLETKVEPPKLWVFGHVHECGGHAYRGHGITTTMVNAASYSRLSESLRPPLVVDFCKETKTVLSVSVIKK